MEVDSKTELQDTEVSSMVPHVDSNPNSPKKSPKERLVDLLDQVEFHVERLRRDALKLEEEKDTLLTTLDTLSNSELIGQLEEEEQNDIYNYADAIAKRCHTVDILVHTNRDGSQEEALHQVNSFIDTLVVNIKVDPFATKEKCVAFMNACSSQTFPHSDKNFESAILGCTLDDQKKIKKRLQGLMDYIDKSWVP